MAGSGNDSYEYLLGEFDEGEIKNTFKYIYRNAAYFLELVGLNCQINPGEDFFINTRIIKETVVDFYSDLERLKQFHNITEINSIKFASYLAYWVNKRKPIQTIAEFTNEKIAAFPKLKFVNESFSHSLLMSTAFKIDSPPPRDYLGYINNFLDLLNYSFRYRVMTAQNLEIILTAYMTNKLYEMLDHNELKKND